MKREWVKKSLLKKIYKKREEWVHKGQFGRLLCVTGNQWNTGSPIFVGMSASRAGCDLVFLTGPERAMQVAAHYSPVLITKPLRGEMFCREHVEEVLRFISLVRPKAALIGNGLWREPETKLAIISLVEKIHLPMILDADAIRAISARKELLGQKKTIILPHANEFRELTGIEVTADLEERSKVVEEQAKVLGTVILLKGHVDVISDGKQTMLNKTGSPLMTKGGMGDTLAGICGALVARGIDLFEAACAAAYINGKAGELVTKELGESALPTDLIKYIYKVIKK